MATSLRRGTWVAVDAIAPRTARNVLTTDFTSPKGTGLRVAARCDAAELPASSVGLLVRAVTPII
jgi:hypothetical protein